MSRIDPFRHPSLLLITGWAYDVDTVGNLVALLSADFEVCVMSGAEVLKTREIPAADYVIGWSMGGMLAMELLPASCKKLVLISSTARFCATNGYMCGIPEKALRRMILQLKRKPDAVLSEFYRKVEFPHVDVKEQHSSFALEELVDGLEYLLDVDLRKCAAAVKIPVLLIHGSEDQIIPPSASAWLADHLPHAELCVFKGAGHGVLLHNAVEMVGSMMRFFW